MTDPADDRAAERERLMLATLPHVAFDGWTRTALGHGATDSRMDGTDVERLFPGGPAELVRAFADWAMVAGADVPIVEDTDPAERARTDWAADDPRFRPIKPS